MIRSLLSSGGSTKCRTIDKLDIFGDGSGKALYRFDGNANDESGNYHGTETNVTYGGGAYERGAVFNGTTSNINLNYNPYADNFSCSFWAKFNNVTTAQHIIGNIISASYYLGWTFAINGGMLSIITDNNTSAPWLMAKTFNRSLSAGVWYHLTLVSNGTINDLFIDAEKITNTNIVDGSQNTLQQSTNNIKLSFDNTLNGSIDQVRIFNRAITAQEVATLYAECEPTSIVDNINPFEDGSLKALYKFDNDATDATGVYNGTATNVTYASGKFGNCAVFNGTDSVVSTGLDTNPALMSFSCWVNLTSTTSGNLLLCTIDTASFATLGFAITVSANTLYFLGAVLGNTWNLNISTPFTHTNVWKHICVTSDNGLYAMYIDGVKATITYTSTTHLPIKGANPIKIGFASANTIHGSIDQVRILNKALTPLEVASLYNETTPMEEPMSVQVDPFKDGSGKALYRLEGNALDESGNYNGTPTSVTYGLGRFGRCAVFNGSTSQITSSYSSSSNSVQSFSFWFKANTSSHLNLLGCSDNSTYGGIIVQWYINKLQILTSNSSSNAWNSLVTTSTLAINTWHHAVVVLTGSAISVYINGALDGNISSLSASASLHSMWVGYGGGGSCFNGSIDQVCIFNKALTQSEVTALYNEI